MLCADKPGPPRSLKVPAVGPDSVTLSWAAPKDDGGSPVTGYVIEKREALRMTWQRVAKTSDTTHKVGRLTEDAPYVFQVSAINAVGVSQPEELGKAVTPKSPYSESHSLRQYVAMG